MNYKVGDAVMVVRGGSVSPWWPLRRFWMPRPGFGHGRAQGNGTIVEVISPSQERGLTNAGAYKVQLNNGSIHYYSEAELRPASESKK